MIGLKCKYDEKIFCFKIVNAIKLNCKRFHKPQTLCFFSIFILIQTQKRNNMSEGGKTDKRLNAAENFILSGSAAVISKTASAPIERVKLMIQNQVINDNTMFINYFIYFFLKKKKKKTKNKNKNRTKC